MMRIRRPDSFANRNVETYETLYTRYKKSFFKSGLLSILFLFILAFCFDQAMTRWFTTGTVLDFQMIMILGIALVCVVGLIDRIPKTIRAHIASSDHNIRQLLECRKILSNYRQQLAIISYDIVSLERLCEDGTSPRELEHIIRNILAANKSATAKATKEKPISRKSEKPESQAPQPLKQMGHQEQKQAILLALKEKEHEIKRRVRKGMLKQSEANVMLQSVRREAKKKLQNLDDFDTWNRDFNF